MAWLPDETSPRGPVSPDPTAGQVIGTAAGVTEPVMDNGGYAVHADYIKPAGSVVSWADAMMQAAPGSYMDNPPPTKVADSQEGLLGPQITPEPVMGDEKWLQQLQNGLSATNAYGPYVRTTDNPSTGQIVANAASKPAAPLGGGEAAMMALLTGAYGG